MTRAEYTKLQERFSAKMVHHNWPTRQEESYNKAILACKSILKEVYKRERKAGVVGGR